MNDFWDGPMRQTCKNCGRVIVRDTVMRIWIHLDAASDDIGRVHCDNPPSRFRHATPEIA